MTDTVNASEFDPSEIVFVTHNVTDTEIAAVTAVVRGLLHEESEVAHGTSEAGRSAWELSQRALRRPVQPGTGAWRGFPA